MPRCRLLVVEDSPTVRQLIVQALGRIPGLEIVEAADGVDALAKLAGQRTDLVLTGVNLPIMEGFKLVRLMKENPLHREIPVVIITGEGGAGDRERALALGARACLPKPVQAGRLREVVRDILDLQG